MYDEKEIKRIEEEEPDTDPNRERIRELRDAMKPICSFITPQHCGLVTTLFGVAGVTRNDVRAGGNARFGRRTMAWQSGGDVLVKLIKRKMIAEAEIVRHAPWNYHPNHCV